jgi:hypothetical protein
MIPPAIRNTCSGARWDPKIISPATIINASPIPVAISHSQLPVSVEINCLNALAPVGAVPLKPAALSPARSTSAPAADAAAVTRAARATRPRRPVGNADMANDLPRRRQLR